MRASRDRIRRRLRGFTLLELLVVLLISVALIAALNGLYRMVGRTSVTLSRDRDDWSATQFIRRQYLMAHPATLDYDLFEAREDTLAFVSYRSARYGEQGPPVLVRYRYDPLYNNLIYQERDLPPWWQEKAGLSLNKRLLESTDGWWEDTAFKQVDGVEFRYFVPDPRKPTWQNRWDQSAALPQLIAVEVKRLGDTETILLEGGVLSFSMPSGY